jgi:hypothetical protein
MSMTRLIPRSAQGHTIGKLGLALAVAAVLVGGALAPAFGDEYTQRHRQQERDWRAHQGYPQAYRPYSQAYPPARYYAPPPVMYSPPPVVYAPLPSPGISLFFGFPIRIR